MRSARLARATLYDGAMRRYAQLARPQRTPPAARRVPRAAARSRTVVRSRAPVVRQTPPAVSIPASAFRGFETDPYLDYGRFLTPEGGILIVYKDLDLRLRHGVLRVLAWSAATGLDAWFLLHHSPVQSGAINLASFFAMMIVNAVIVWKPPELYRTVEIRPDCMIIEGKDVFWLRMMETAWPAFHPDKDGNQILSGIYGTRFVEYLTARRFDEHDRMSEVFAAHLQEAMMQLWAPPETRQPPHGGSPRWQG
jgi:hypothetical protein